jgi:hypothetical protein
MIQLKKTNTKEYNMFRYDKDNLFKEFYVAKEKDVKLSKKETLEEKELDVYKNRIQFFKDHIELKSKHPEYYEMLMLNLINYLLCMKQKIHVTLSI